MQPIKSLTQKGLILVVGLFFVCNTGQTQSDTKIDTGKVYQLGEVIISASKLEQDPSSVGRNVTVISQQEIQESMHQSVGDLLAEQQNIHMVGTGQTPGSLQNVFLRNTNSNHTVVMIDGVRISDPSSVDNSIDLSELSLANVERIEIVRGSHSTLYGSSAIGGVINVITRGRESQGLYGTVESAHGTFGSNTYSLNNRLNAGYALDSGLYFNLGVSQEATRGLDATVDTVTNPNVFNLRDRDDFDKLDLSGKIGYRSNGWDLSVSYRNQDQGLDLDDGSFNDDDNARIDFNRDLVSYNVSRRLSDRVRLKYKGGYSDLKRDFVNDSSVVDRAGNFDGSFTETNARGSLWENELTLDYESDRFTLIGGLSRSEQTMSTRTFTFVRPFNFRSETDLDSLDLEEVINSAFIHTEWNGSLISEKLESLSLVLGGRILDHNRFGTHATYEINPRLRISDRTLVYGAITSGFNAPSLFRLHSPEQGFGAFTNRGNENLDPETSISYEIGWKQDIGSKVHFDLSLFKTKTDDIIEFVYLWNKNTPVGNLAFSDFLGDTYINISEQDINGIELGLEADLLPELRFSGTFSYSSSTLSFAPENIDESYTGGHHVQIFESGAFVNGDREIDGLTRRPSVSSNLNLRYRPSEGFGIELNSRFVGERDDILFSSALGPIGALDRSEVDSYNVTDVSVRYDLARQLRIGLKVENVFDSDYTEIRGFTTRGRGVYGRVQYSF